MGHSIIFSDIIERDVDFAIIRSFLDYPRVRDLFFSQINMSGEVVRVYHSLVQEERDGHIGESDIVIICQNENKKFAIFIEDKIAADPQPFQRERYDDRARKLMLEEGFEEYFIFLCAPTAYIHSTKVEGYERFVSHEDINGLLNENDLTKSILNFSCDVKKQGYNVIKNDAVTDFWKKLYDYMDEKYDKLKYKKNIKPRGGRADWVNFKTDVKGIIIVWKSTLKWNRVDLEFSGMADKEELFKKIVIEGDLTKYEPSKTSKSLSLTVRFPESQNVSFHKPFEKQIDNIDKFLSVVVEFYELVRKLYYSNVLDWEHFNLEK